MNQIRLPQNPVVCQNFVAGKWESARGEKHELVSPYFGKAVGSFVESTAEDVARAVAAAKHASIFWTKAPIKERTQIMFRFREILLRDIDAISQRISLESGKTLAEAHAGLMKGIEVLEFALSLQNREEGGRLEVSRGVFCETRREPVGVVAGITPFNFPAMVPMWMIPIALTLGNSFIWKPSDKTPMTSLLIANALQEAGLPDGVFTVVQGGRTAVEALLDPPDIGAVGFVGSTPVARSVYQRGSKSGKRVLALGGAKNHIILMPDADPDIAARGIADSFTGCAGQRCMAASVLLAVGDVDSLIDGVVSKVKEIKVGETMGAIISRTSEQHLRAAIDRAAQSGAKVLTDGRTFKMKGDYAGGNWLAPTVLDQVQPKTEAATIELFGPILSIVRVKNLSDAIAIENASPYGNAASVFTSNGAVAERVAAESHVGMVGVNVGVPVPREPFSFGGAYESKFGIGDMTGTGSLNLWSSLKKITTRWGNSSDRNWMN